MSSLFIIRAPRFEFDKKSFVSCGSEYQRKKKIPRKRDKILIFLIVIILNVRGKPASLEYILPYVPKFNLDF